MMTANTAHDALARLRTLAGLLDTRDCLDYDMRTTLVTLLADGESAPDLHQLLPVLLHPERSLHQAERLALSTMLYDLHTTLHAFVTHQVRLPFP